MIRLLPILSLLSLCAASAAESSGPRPNFLVIVADDQSPFTLTTYGDQVCDTPHLDQLAKEGMTFDGAYHMGSWSGAVCTPSRHMIMSGRTVWHLPKVKGPPGSEGLGAPKNLPEMTMAAVFNRAGYDTMRTCKRGNSYEAANKQFAVRRDASKRAGTVEGGSAWHGDQVMDYLKTREQTKDEDPFLIYFGFSHPHDPRHGTPELLEKYGANDEGATKVNSKVPKLPSNYLPAHPFPHGHPGLRDEERVQGVMLKRDEATVRNEVGREFACIENMDTQIGRVLKKLEAMNELENTYVIFTSDHGMSVGRHGLMGKQNLYEHTWRVPYLVKGPGIKAGSRAQGNIYLLDTLATLCELAGIEAPKTNEGKSFKPVLKGEAESTRDVLYGVYCGGTKPGMRSVKKGDWKLIKYDVLDGKVRETQLFNLAENPDEFLAEHHDAKMVAKTGQQPEPQQQNLAKDKKHADVLKEMEELLHREMKRLDDPYRLWDQPK